MRPCMQSSLTGYVQAMAETPWYDARGTATAFVAEDDVTICLWNGRAVAYLVDDKIYSWSRGRHLGWFVDGIAYDGRGRGVGYVEAHCPVAVAASTAAGPKSAKSARSARSAAQARPALSTLKSTLALGAFLQS